MRFSLFIALRYFFSPRKLRVINLISIISLVGISVTTCALCVVLSVFNGFTQLSERLLSSCSAPLVIEASGGKVFSITPKKYNKIKALPSVALCCRVIKQNAIASYGENQTLVQLMGVEDNYNRINNLDTSMVYGSFHLYRNSEPCCVAGIGLAASLSLPKNAETMGSRLTITLPNRFASSSSINAEEVFISRQAAYSGCFETKSEQDASTLILPLALCADMLSYQSTVNSLLQSSIYIKPSNPNQIRSTSEQIAALINDSLQVKDIFAQQPLYNKVVKMERIGVYLILSFIIFIATFNVIGALSLLVMDKRRDMFILHSLGARSQQIKDIYLFNAIALCVFGALIGIVLSLILCWAQEHWGLIQMSNSADLIIKAFPVQVKPLDLVVVFLTVTLMGLPLQALISHKAAQKI